MKILHVLTSSTFSGAENVVVQIINLFKGSNIEMVYASPMGDIMNKLSDNRIHYLPLKKFSLSEIRRVIKDFKPDLIHSHDMRASFMVSLVNNNIPFISHIHNNNFDSRKLSFKALAFLYAGIKAKHLIWVSKSSFNGYKFHRYLSNKSTILYNVIDAEIIEKSANMASDKDCYDVIFLGRLTYQKNPHCLISVIDRLCELMPNVQIAIVGTGDLAEETRELVNRLNLQNNVTFKGFLDNPYGLLKNAKVMIMTSRWEGTPMCALESLSLGTPIVSTPVDGLMDIIVSEKNGYLGTNKEELAKHLFDIVSNEELRSKLSKEALNSFKSFNDLQTYKRIISRIYIGNE